MGIWTNSGLTLVATAVQTPGAVAGFSHVAISPGCGTVSSAITASTPLTSLPLDGTLPANIAASQSLTVTDGTNSETVTCNGGASAGATSIPINSWTPANSYAAHVTGVCPTPAATDSALYGESARVAVTAASAGSNPGESLVNGYFDGSQSTAIYLLVGYFGGSSSSLTLASGVLMGEDIVFWNHTANADTFMYQSDSTI